MKISKIALSVLALSALTPAVGLQAGRINNGVALKATDGTTINAHGGGMLIDGGYYYWFGENRKGMASDGVSVYRSTDLISWENLGLALTPSGERKNTLQDVAPGRTLERPKVVFNKKTGKYVMWAHWEDGNDYTKARVMVATADRPEGPYTFVRTMRPNGQESRDQTVFVDLDGKAYHFRSSEDNMTLQCSPLTDDYLLPQESFIRSIPGKQYEAPAIMRINDTYIGFFSGCTGWRPNPGHVCTTRNILTDSWNDLGNPCVDDNASTTYQSQPTYVLKLQGYDYAYMYMGDRWNSSNVQTSTYVWLPIYLRTGKPFLRWHSAWDTSMFETLDAIRRAASIEDNGSYVLLSSVADRMVSLHGGAVCTYDDNDKYNLSFAFEPAGEAGSYRLRNEADGSYLAADGSNAVLAADNASDDKQVWLFERQSDGFYIVANKATGRVLSVKDGSMAADAPIELVARTTTAKARFGVYFDRRKHDYEENSPFGMPYEPAGVENVNAKAGFAVSLSAAGGVLGIVMTPDADLEPTDLSIYDASGRLVYNAALRSSGGMISESLPALRAGIYIVRVANGGNAATAKVAL